MFQVADKNKNGQVSLSELVVVMTSLVGGLNNNFSISTSLTDFFTV